MTAIPDHVQRRCQTASDEPVERLGLALVLAIILLIVACSFLVA
jgi:hypothetical protein